MLRSDSLAKYPLRNVAEIFWRRKQMTVFQLIALHRVSDVVRGEGEAVDFYQQRLIGQGGVVRQLRLDDLALLQIVACNDEVGGGHGFGPGIFPAVIFAFDDDRFATTILFKTSFAFSRLADHALALLQRAVIGPPQMRGGATQRTPWLRQRRHLFCRRPRLQAEAHLHPFLPPNTPPAPSTPLPQPTQ